MDILFCNIGEHPFYNGDTSIKLIGGGKWNKEKIGGEINNFTNCNGTYYGHVEATSSVIAVEKRFKNIFGKEKKDKYAVNVLVVWTANKKIVGWYNNATVYRERQYVYGVGRYYEDYNISSKNAVLVPAEQRVRFFDFTFRYTYFAEDEKGKEIIKKVLKYIDEYEKYLEYVNQKSEEELNNLDESKLIGEDVEHLGKYRRNQEAFRRQLIKKYDGKCSICQCEISFEDVLIASHIKPWADSDCNEKLLSCNGLLLCPNHDKLFDKFLISFDDDGKILISEELKRYSPHLFTISKNTRIEVDESMKPFLAYHRAKFFEKNK